MPRRGGFRNGDMIRVAIIGIGGYGRNLTKLLLAAEDKGLCRLVAAADGRLGELAAEADRLRQRGVKLHSGAMEMLDELRGRCEAVYVAVGIASHRELTCAAAGRGLHVHLEKPPAATVTPKSPYHRCQDNPTPPELFV